MRRAALGLAAVLTLAACATPAGMGPRVTRLGEAPYRVGTLSIWIRPQAEVEILCRMAQRAVPADRDILGCYIDATRTIVSVDDAWVLMHELKHHFEGRWHEEISAP